MKLVTGNKNYSSWSLRAWPYLRQSRVDFEELRIALFVDDLVPADRSPRVLG